MILSAEESRSLASFVTDRTSDGLLCTDTEGKILFANEAAARTLGLAADQLADRDLFALAPELNSPLWKELWKEIRSNASFSFEFNFLAVAERPVQVEISAHYLKPGDRELACILFRDVEERKRLQNLQQEFVSTASHELRSPMTVIREGISQVLDGLRGEVTDSQRRALSIALTGIDRLSRMIEELLDMSKIESGKIVLRRERIDAAAVAREVAASFQGQAADRGIDLRVATPAGPVMVFADRDRLIQVFTNLVGNAFKFTEKGMIEIAMSLRKGELESSVSDTGMGLAPGDADKIFNKFEQLGQVSVTGEKGTGLGLSITRGIVELHKGHIQAESAGPGKGTRISFVLPSLSGRDVFTEQLRPLLREVARRGGSMTVILFHLENLGLDPIENGLANVLADLDPLVRRQSGRVSDLLVVDRDMLYLALQSTIKREAIRVAEKIVEAFQDSVERIHLKNVPKMSYRATGFPEEIRDQETFVEKLFQPRAR